MVVEWKVRAANVEGEGNQNVIKPVTSTTLLFDALDSKLEKSLDFD